MNECTQNPIYGVIDTIAREIPDANLQLVAIGLGADSAVLDGNRLTVVLPDGRYFTYIR